MVIDCTVAEFDQLPRNSNGDKTLFCKSGCGQTMRKMITAPQLNTLACSGRLYEAQYNPGLGVVTTGKRDFLYQAEKRNLRWLGTEKPSNPTPKRTEFNSATALARLKEEGVFMTEEEWKGNGDPIPLQNYLDDVNEQGKLTDIGYEQGSPDDGYLVVEPNLIQRPD